MSQFQSTPAITGGRDYEELAALVRQVVSIHARHYWRARRYADRARPRLGAVSIHARHYWRARPSGAWDRRSRWRVSIHARHYWRARRPLPGPAAPVRRFNPRPPLLAGETAAIATRYLYLLGFNPRPPLLAGETHGTPTIQFKTRIVSIHARHYWRARLRSYRHACRLSWFQSTPAITGGRDRICVCVC